MKKVLYVVVIVVILVIVGRFFVGSAEAVAAENTEVCSVMEKAVYGDI